MVGVAVGVAGGHEGAEGEDELVPSLDGGEVDAGGFDDVGAVGEHDGVDVVREAEDAAA